MKICVDLPTSFDSYLERLVVQRFYDTSTQAFELLVLQLLMDDLDRACVLGKDEAVNLILAKPAPLENKTTSLNGPTPSIAPVTDTHKPFVSTNGNHTADEPTTSPVAPPVAPQQVIKLKPGQRKIKREAKTNSSPSPSLKVPIEMFQQSRSYTFITWGWCMSLAHNAAREGQPSVYKTFTLNDAMVAIRRDLGVTINTGTLNSALKVLSERGWLNENTDPFPIEYTLSNAARKWVNVPANQALLIEKGFLKEAVA